MKTLCAGEANVKATRPAAGAAPTDEGPTDEAPTDEAPTDEGPTEKDTPPGHSMHGEAFNEGPRQRATLMAGTGRVHFPITTRVPEAQAFFNQGVGQLHGFWYFEAERSFRQVAALDADCAMAYWGMAMANANNDERAAGFIKIAQEKKTNASPREAAWIDALAGCYEGKDSHERRKKYVAALEALVHDDPNDVEAKAFLALRIWQNDSWMTEPKMRLPIVSHQAVDSVLDQVFAANPSHPAHHYRIHLWDRQQAARALVSASLCGQSAPAVAHMWHMPGHIYSKLHRYADAVWQQEASARVDHAHMMRDRILPDQIHNYAHNNEWLIRNLAFLGRVDDAIALARNMIELPRHPRYNTLEKSASASYGHRRLADVLVQYERWDDVLRLAATSYLPESDKLEDKIKRHVLVGRAALARGDQQQGAQHVADLEALLAERRQARYAAADEADAKAKQNKKSAKDAAQAMTDALLQHGDDLKKVETALTELRGYAALAAGEREKAKSLFEKLKDADSPRQDHLALAWAETGDLEQAVVIARKAAADAPGEVYPLAVLVDLLQRAGNTAEVHAEFAKLRTLAADADLDNAVFNRLRPVAEALRLPADWRIAREPSLDVGVRPELATLGPFRWTPTPADGWSLHGADGQPVSLDQYRNRPVIVIFYLGSGCLHCVEQLKKFAPLTEQFTQAGMALVGISSEPLDSLTESLASLSPDKPLPFRLAADPELAAFKAYRAYDDFENVPLHGVFLIDGDGLVRWHDIGFEPFTDAEFLLKEAQRLLGHK